MTTTSQKALPAIFTLRTTMLIIMIAIMSFGALLTLLAWGPDIRSKDRAGAHAWSSSAIGYGGLVGLLELRGTEVSLSRTRQRIDQYNGLLVLTPGSAATGLEDHLPLQGPALVILPKWAGAPDPLRPKWQNDTSLRSTNTAETLVHLFDEDADITQIIPPNVVRTPYGQFQPDVAEKMQLIKSDLLETVIAAPTGTLLAKLAGEDIYILADPDLANTFGLANADNARLMLSILDNISTDRDAPIIFDTTLNGFGRSTSLLRIMLDIPFLGATLIMLCGFGLLGWRAGVRFGAPAREAIAIALGKQALADNTAALFTVTQRETRMAPGYLALTRKVTARALGAPAGLSEAELAALFDRLGPDGSGEERWTAMANGLKTPSGSRDELLDKAQRLYRWRKEKTHGY